MIRTIHKYKALIVGFIILNAAYTNCGQSFKTTSTDGLSAIIPMNSASGTLSKSAGVFDNNCMQNNAYDACIFWKSPVSAAGNSFAGGIKQNSDVSAYQNFGVKLDQRSDGQSLQSPTITVSTSGGSPLNASQFTNGRFKTSYKDESGRAWTTQLLSYFWLTFQEKEMKARTGSFFAANKNISVDVYQTQDADGSTTNSKNNAHYSQSSNSIAAGFVADKNGNLQREFALDSEILMHEMGHANFFFAQGINTDQDSHVLMVAKDLNGKIVDRPGLVDGQAAGLQVGDSYLFQRCATKNGCSSAMEEGLADFHFMMMFPERPSAGDTYANNTNGTTTLKVPRNPLLTYQWTTNDFFTKSAYYTSADGQYRSGEIHAMGSAYASILFEIYINPKMKRNHFEKMFVEHLKMLTADSDFSSALQIFITLAENMTDSFDGVNYAPLITEIFNRKGVSL